MPRARRRLQVARRVLDVRPAARDRRARRRTSEASRWRHERPLVGVPRLGAVPADGGAAGRREPGEERGLARAGGRDDERQALAERAGEPRLEPLAGQRRLDGQRHAHLGRDDGRRLGPPCPTLTRAATRDSQCCLRRDPPVGRRGAYGATAASHRSSDFAGVSPAERTGRCPAPGSPRPSPAPGPRPGPRQVPRKSPL